MPLYKFKCKECDTEQERIAKLGQTSVTCDCGSKAVKSFSANAASFKVNGVGAYNSGVMKAK
tara:strand:+ start:14946 stop:15131 length:186 start_codon:yes stop_codon:yes gene_type:complete